MLLFSILLFLTGPLIASSQILRTVDIEGSSPLLDINSGGAAAGLLGDFSHIQMRKNGAIADTPSIQGLSNDRVNIQIDGTIITNSCPNHMNPALSFVHADQVVGIESYAGLDPVSNGGDNIAGSILVRTKKIQFSDILTSSVKVRTFYKSNNSHTGAALKSDVSSKNYYFSYEGIQEKAGRYLDGRGERLKGTIFEQNNQGLTIARKMNKGEVSLKLTRSNIPYQGFVNQYMDLLDNQTDRAQLSINKSLNQLKLEFLSSWTNTHHYMNMISSERMGNMPMDTRSDEFNTSLKLTYGPTLRFGLEYFQYRLEDWWDPVAGTMMGPNAFTSIHHGERERLGAYIEDTFNKGETFEVLTGVRSDVVMMNSGKVNGYGVTPSIDATYFNSQKRAKSDLNIDAIIALKYRYDNSKTWEMGYARKSRSPNMYERYAWAGTQTPQGMAMRMINWFGDGNGYVGDVDLKPEVAHKFSTKFSYNDRERFKFELSPFFNYVENFIDADLIRSMGNTNFLQFTNTDAVLYGVDFNSDLALYSSQNLGELSLHGSGSYTRGYRVDKKADLYQLKPLNLRVSLRHQHSFWGHELTLQMVSHKKTVNKLRREASTAGHGLLDYKTSFKWSKFTWELGVSNILDKDYQMPLAGVDLINHAATSRTAQFGMGRSYNTNLLMEF